FQGGPISACIRRSEMFSPWYPPFRQNFPANRALAAKRLAHSRREISLDVSSRTHMSPGWTNLKRYQQALPHSSLLEQGRACFQIHSLLPLTRAGEVPPQAAERASAAGRGKSRSGLLILVHLLVVLLVVARG